MATEKGRGATANGESRRFNMPERKEDGDWLDALTEIDGAPPRRRTEVTIERARTIISRNNSPDIAFSQSINAYRGCEHGCIYCFARPTHAYHDLSPGLDFETRLFAKPDAAALLRKELSRKSHLVSPIAMGTNTDPYQPIERDWKITRQCLEILWECRHPVYITTKSDRIVRDLDIVDPVGAGAAGRGDDFGDLAEPAHGPNIGAASAASAPAHGGYPDAGAVGHSGRGQHIPDHPCDHRS